MAGKRVTAARLARRFPRIYEAIADGRLHVTAICLLSKPLRGLTGEEAHGLIDAAEHKTNDQIRLLLAERFPQADLATRIRPVRGSDAPPTEVQPKVLDLSGKSAPERVAPTEEAESPEEGHAEPAAKGPQTQPDRTAPLSPWPLRAPAQFQSENGRHCEERSDLEYDHVIPRARGGKSTVDNLRLRCFAHDQLEAERMFGAGFMESKRAAARQARLASEADDSARPRSA